jgi:hypothetical protein
LIAWALGRVRVGSYKLRVELGYMKVAREFNIQLVILY